MEYDKLLATLRTTDPMGPQEVEREMIGELEIKYVFIKVI